MKLPHRRQFLHLAAGAAALPAVSRIARAQAYPSRPVRLIVTVAAGGSPDIIARLIGAMAVGTARTAVRRREPAGRRRQYRHRGRRPGAARRLHADAGDVGERHQRVALPEPRLQFHPRHRAGREHLHHALVMEVNPSVPAQTVPEFIAYAKANPGKINMASGGTGSPLTCRRRTVQDDGRGRHDPRALSRRGAGASRSDQRPGAGHVRRHARVDRLYQSRQAARARRDHAPKRSEVLPDVPALGEFLPGFEASGWYGIGAPKARRARSSTGSTGDQCGARRSEDAGAPRRSRHARRSAARPPTSASSSPTKPRSGPR